MFSVQYIYKCFKGALNMEELKNEPKGIISEEALDQVAAGINIDRATLRKAAKIAGIVVVSGAALTGAGIGGKALIDRRRSTDKSINDIPPTPPLTSDTHDPNSEHYVPDENTSFDFTPLKL